MPIVEKMMTKGTAMAAGGNMRPDRITSGVALPLSDMAARIRELVPGADVSVGPGVYKRAGTMAVQRKGALDCSRARTAFGYVPRHDLASGLADYVAACRRGLGAAREAV